MCLWGRGRDGDGYRDGDVDGFSVVFRGIVCMESGWAPGVFVGKMGTG